MAVLPILLFGNQAIDSDLRRLHSLHKWLHVNQGWLNSLLHLRGVKLAQILGTCGELAVSSAAHGRVRVLVLRLNYDFARRFRQLLRLYKILKVQCNLGLSGGRVLSEFKQRG